MSLLFIGEGDDVEIFMDEDLINSYIIEFDKKLEEVIIQCKIRRLLSYTFAKKIATKKLMINKKSSTPDEIKKILNYFSEIDDLVIITNSLNYDEILEIASVYTKYAVYSI